MSHSTAEASRAPSPVLAAASASSGTMWDPYPIGTRSKALRAAWYASALRPRPLYSTELA